MASQFALVADTSQPNASHEADGLLVTAREADFVALNPRVTPLLARRTAQTETLAKWLFGMIVLVAERLIAHTVIPGQSVNISV